MEGSPTVIGNGVYVGPNSVIAMGVTIGDCVVIGAMAFVNKPIPPRKKAWGCPAVVSRQRGIHSSRSWCREVTGEQPVQVARIEVSIRSLTELAAVKREAEEDCSR